ncbi:hypothetical protein ACFY7C_37300 [Streptomyces sp. NPDC012769]|uniref:hypothetical protein n=1 Tax=Streptomyces sp. NPDC012769 TaxID=3364848 RepID=UPI003690CE8E
MTDHDDHIQHTWILTHPTGDEITIDLWTDGESVRVEGGGHESTDGGRKDVERLLEKYALRGYWVTSDYAVNDPHEPELRDATQPTTAHPPRVRWHLEFRDPVADEWIAHMTTPDRDKAITRLQQVRSSRPLWAPDDQPVERRLVRETTTWTVEEDETR